MDMFGGRWSRWRWLLMRKRTIGTGLGCDVGREGEFVGEGTVAADDVGVNASE